MNIGLFYIISDKALPQRDGGEVGSIFFGFVGNGNHDLIFRKSKFTQAGRGHFGVRFIVLDITSRLNGDTGADDFGVVSGAVEGHGFIESKVVNPPFNHH